MPSPSATGRSHIATLDLLRLGAALAVVAFHYLFRGAAADGYLAAGYPEAAPAAMYGYLGVNLFFLISGFVIAWSAEGKDWRVFSVARFARLYPGFLACMTITFLVMLLAGPPLFSVSIGQYLANLLMFAPALGQPFMDGAYWSIVLEIIFYGWIALALLAGVFDRLRLELVAGWLAVCALNEFVIGSGALRLLFLTEFGPFFAAGMLVQYMHSRGRSADALALLAAAFLLSCATMTVDRAWMLAHYGTAVPLGHLIAANALMLAMLVAAARFGTVLAPSPLIVALGGITYPLYLLHQHIGYVAINALAPMTGKWLAAGMALAAMLALSLLVWKYVETPARQAIIRLARPLTGGGLRPSGGLRATLPPA